MTKQPPDPSTYEGDEGTPPAQVPPPVRYRPDASVPVPAPPPANPPAASSGPPTAVSHASTGDRLAAASGPLSLILFFVLGFAADQWAWAWIVFLIPPVIYAWNRADHRDDKK